MREVRPLTAEERTALNRMRRQEVGRVSLRAPRRRRSDTPWTVPPIAALLERSRGTVRAGIERCERWGPAGLDDEERRGRPRKINRAVEGPLTRWMAADPPRGQGRVRAPFGTIPRLVLALRPRLAMPLKPAPPTREKPWALVQAVVEAGPEAGVRAAHASRGPTRPWLRARWPWVGPPLRGPTPGANTARAIVGAVHIRTGQWSYLVRAHMRTEDGRAVHEHRLVVSPPQPILVMVDPASRHPAERVEEGRHKPPRVPWHRLSQSCSHLPPVAAIWRRMHTESAAHRLWGAIQVVLRTLEAGLARLPPEPALEWAATASP